MPLILVTLIYCNKEYVGGLMGQFDKWFKMNPWLGFLAFSCAYYVWIPMVLPSSIMNMFGGFLFAQYYGKVRGFFLCVAAIWMSHPLAALLTFLMARYLFKDFIKERVIDRFRVFRAIDQSLSTQGLKLIILLKVQPVIPWNILNYLLAVTSCSSSDFFLGTFVGIAPKTLTVMYLGVSVESLAEVVRGGGGSDRSGWQKVVELTLLSLSLLSLLTVAYIIMKQSRKELDKMLEVDDSKEAETVRIDEEHEGHEDQLGQGTY